LEVMSNMTESEASEKGLIPSRFNSWKPRLIRWGVN
jgi:hypothetical protein